MRHSLLSRFQGTLSGMALGEALGYYRRATRSLSTPAQTNPYYWHPGLIPLPADSHRQELAWGRAAALSAETLIKRQIWDSTASEQVWRGGLANGLLEPCATGMERTIAAVPVMLFYHEEPFKLRQVLEQTAQQWEADENSMSGILAIGYAIAAALRETLEPTTLIPRTLNFLRHESESSTPLLDLLEQVHGWLQQQADLSTVISRLQAMSAAENSVNARRGSEGIALAFYCFLSTLEDFHLSLIRAARSPISPQLVCALTAALSGAYNSRTAVPLSWRLSCASLWTWGMALEEIEELAARLLAVWSGAYDPEGLDAGSVAIAAPNVIRSR